ncbi:LysR family transcriptional regulator [Aquitalea sp. LB_tupeE]|uniref:LysR family transcriptional regulator n=1 Tax=Aquitalea sp. LB_tupeE TaxID=2748078 RepID=UPI001C4CD090|nr:LysR family transcriptional regulator [Aquitalea sp. LB_tupeE]
MMEVRDVKAFVVLGELLHFGQAASRLHITQSALSKQIRRLEDEVGAALFERSAGGTVLSSLGQALHADACQWLEDGQIWLRKAKAVQAGTAGSLRIGFGSSTHALLPALLSHFRQQRPQVQIVLNDLSSHHQWQAMREGRLDLGFCRLPAPVGWPCLTVLQDRFMAVLPAELPPDGTLQDLAALPLALVGRDKAPAYHDHVQHYLASAQLHSAGQQNVSDFPAAIALAAAGIAWSIIPASTSLGQQRVRTVQLEGEAACWEIGLIRPPGKPSALVAGFWELAAQHLATHRQA